MRTVLLLATGALCFALNATAHPTRLADHDADQEAAPASLDPAVQSLDADADAAQDAAFQEARHYSQRALDHEQYENDEDIVYDFSYEVKDPQSGNDFGHRQSRAGGVTQGQYRVLLPDGRMQVVDYVSDRGGFRPSVRYEDVGIAVFAGSENHDVFEDGTNVQDQSGQGEFQRRRRRRR